MMSDERRGSRTIAGGPAPVLAVALALLRHLRILIVVPIGVTVMAIGVVLIRGRSYTAEAVIAPERSAGPASRIAGFAAQLGLGSILGAGGEPVEFYAAVVQSRELLRQVSQAEYTIERGLFRRDTVQGTLVELWEIKGETPDEALSATVDRLRESVEVISDAQAGILRVRTKAKDRFLAEQISRWILTYVNEFNVDKRQTQAEQERRFIEGRLEVARAELEAAEDELASFYDANRSYQNSPRLAFEAARLERRVQIHQAVYRTLAEAYEQARIQEVRNTPVLTIVDPPEGSARPAIPLRLLAALVFSISALLSVALVLVLEYLRQERAADLVEIAGIAERPGNPVGIALVAKLVYRLLGQERAAELPARPHLGGPRNTVEQRAAEPQWPTTPKGRGDAG